MINLHTLWNFIFIKSFEHTAVKLSWNHSGWTRNRTVRLRIWCINDVDDILDVNIESSVHRH